MKLNTDIRLLVKGKNITYPSKRSMNLYFKEDRTTAPVTVVLYVAFALVLLLALSKLMIYDPWNEQKHLEQQLLILEQQQISQMAELKNYHQVLKEYVRVTPTEEELSQVDCLEILSLIDNTIRPVADISQISISENKVLISFSGVTLSQAGTLVSQLEQSPLVTNTSVDTAASTGKEQSLVEVHVYFEVAKEEETTP